MRLPLPFLMVGTLTMFLSNTVIADPVPGSPTGSAVTPAIAVTALQNGTPSAHSTWADPTTIALYDAAKSGSETSFQRLLGLAQTGDGLAQVEVAICYDDAHGTARNPAAADAFAHKALAALTQAAGQGIAVAEDLLGLLYMKGLGVRLDNTQALHWYQASADQADPEGERLLGMMYGSGRAVT